MTRSLPKRIASSWVLVCWLWFSAAAPFGHVCVRGPSGTHLPSISAGIQDCAACEWTATQKNSCVAAPPAVSLPRETAQVWTILPVRASYAPVHLLPSRAPPVVS